MRILISKVPLTRSDYFTHGDGSQVHILTKSHSEGVNVVSLMKDLTGRVLTAVESAFPAALAATRPRRAAQVTQALSTQSAATQPNM